jgi:DNA polymerase-3 subunit chi
LTPQVIFIVLNSAVKQRTLCDLAEKLYLTKKHVVIHVADDREGDFYDKLIWTWKQSSFIPHKFVNVLNEPHDEPIVITQKILQPANFDILILAAPAPKEVTDLFQIIIDFADRSDQNLLLQSRERYKTYRSYQYALKNMQAGDFLTSGLF